MRWILSLFVLVPLVEGNALAAGQLALPGQYHGNEMPIPVAPGQESWLGLYNSPTGLIWKSTAPAFQPSIDPVLDAPGQETGVEINVPGDPPLLLVRGVPALQPGSVRTLPLANQPLGPGAHVVLEGGFSLDAAINEEGVYELKLMDAQLTSQILCSHDVLYDETVPTLVLAGDLDRDGHLDLLIDTSNHYNLSRLTLYLSSSATGGEWVAPVAVLQTTGC